MRGGGGGGRRRPPPPPPLICPRVRLPLGPPPASRYDPGMPSTARRRWSKELDFEIDGIALSSEGPILIHGYEAPAGGMWIDEVIPGKLLAMDRSTGDGYWHSPCEVGYGRGFGAGFGEGEDIIVLGPSANGHRIIRMDTGTGKLLGAEPIDAFDEAHVWGDICVCAKAGQVFAISSAMMQEAWRFSREGQRFHQVARSGDWILVVHSDRKTHQKGVLALDAVTGEVAETVLAPTIGVLDGIAADGQNLCVLTADVAALLPVELATSFLADLEERGGPHGDIAIDRSTLLGLSVEDERARVVWYEILSTQSGDADDVSITADSGKLYISRGAMVEVRDLVSGRLLGEWTVPGLDEQVAWQVSSGAGLLAEENRISVFELPA